LFQQQAKQKTSAMSITILIVEDDHVLAQGMKAMI